MNSRRRFLAGLLAASATPRLTWADAGSPSFLAAAREPSGDFALFGVTAAGAITFRLPLPARAHAGARHPGQPLAVVFARRPGSYAFVLNCVTGAVLEHLTPPEGRQFNGHGVFVQNGEILVTSEQLAEGSEGRLGLWRTADFTRIGELPSHGTGPHEITALADDKTLVIANGGIATDPTDRTKLNIPTMRPNLTLASLDGAALDQVEAEDLSQNSIRHLAVRADGLIGFAMQWEGPPDQTVPLLGLYRSGQPLRLAAAPEAEQRVLRGYAGSIALSGAGDEVALTSPRGGRLHRFSDAGDFLGATERRDVCGLTGAPGGFVASDGLGGLLSIKDGTPALLARHDVEWDNHIVPV